MERDGSQRWLAARCLLIWLTADGRMISIFSDKRCKTVRHLTHRVDECFKHVCFHMLPYHFWKKKKICREASGPRWGCKKEVWPPTLHFAVFLSQAHITSWKSHTHTHTVSLTFCSVPFSRCGGLISLNQGCPCISVRPDNFVCCCHETPGSCSTRGTSMCLWVDSFVLIILPQEARCIF